MSPANSSKSPVFAAATPRAASHRAAGSAPRVCLVSHRLGGYDGVSVEAAKWHDAFARLGCSVTRVAGFFADGVSGTDVEVAGLWAAVPGQPPPPPDIALIERLCRTHDLLVLDNVGSLPSAPLAALAFEESALRAAIPTIVRHHDPPWQAATLHQPPLRGFPLHDSRMLHVTINRHTEKEFRRRYPHLGRSDSVATVHNTVDVAALQTGDRRKTRRQMNIGEADILIAHPARNVERKNIPAGIELAAELHRRTGSRVHYWLTDGTGVVEMPAGLLTVHRGHARHAADLYAAADFVALPSTWEGWGLPVVESAAAHRIAVTNTYPVLPEIHGLGIVTVDHRDIGTITELITDAEKYRTITAANHQCARQLDISGLPAALGLAHRRAGELMTARRTESRIRGSAEPQSTCPL